MKKSKLVLSCMICLLVIVTLVCVGCNGGGSSPNGGEPNGQTPGGDVTTPTDPVLTGMNSFFGGARASVDSDTIKDENNVERTFEYLLNRQIDVFATDVLFRLQTVYGTSNDGTLTDKNLNYSYRGGNAIVDKSKLLTTKTSASGSYVDDITKYQGAVNAPGSTSNRVNAASGIKLTGAIRGSYTTYHTGLLAMLGDENSSKQWKYPNESLYNSTYKNNFKMAVAQMLAGKTSYSTFIQSSFNQLLTEINTIGFDADIQQKIVEFVYSNIIGTNLVNESNRIRATYTAENEKLDYNWKGSQTEINKHYYKAYDIIVPTVVEMALANKFGTGSQTLYPVVGRNSSKVLTFNELKTFDNYSEVYLMHNSGIKPRAIKFNLLSNGTSNGKRVTVKVEVINNNSVVVAEKTITTLTLTGSNEVNIPLNINSFGNYTGNRSNDYVSQNLFGASAMPNDATLFGKTYIKLSFESDTEFGLDFKGMMNK